MEMELFILTTRCTLIILTDIWYIFVYWLVLVRNEWLIYFLTQRAQKKTYPHLETKARTGFVLLLSLIEVGMDYHQKLQRRRYSGLAQSHEVDNRSSTYSTDAKSSHATRQGHSASALPNLKRRYIPSLYHNQDKILTRKVKEFLKKPPLNSQEYFDMLWLRRQSEPFRDNEDDLRAIKSAPSSPDELSKKLWRLLPEKRTIQSMILPPIREGCISNYHNKHASKATPLVDPSVDIMDQLTYCRYLRPKPKRHKAWEDTSHDRYWGKSIFWI